MFSYFSHYKLAPSGFLGNWPESAQRKENSEDFKIIWISQEIWLLIVHVRVHVCMCVYVYKNSCIHLSSKKRWHVYMQMYMLVCVCVSVFRSLCTHPSPKKGYFNTRCISPEILLKERPLSVCWSHFLVFEHANILQLCLLELLLLISTPL